MRKLHTLHVVPALPDRLLKLRAIAYDLHWSWDHSAIDLFMRLDSLLWRKVDQNPIQMLAVIPQARLLEVAKDEGFLNHLDRVAKRFEAYRNENTWYSKTFDDENVQIAYFSLEFGLHECLPIYSGGLGLLAGDHLKAASDLGVPLIGISLLYQRGYFHQYLNADGWQQEDYPETDLFNLPIKLVETEAGDPVEFTIRVGPRDVHVHIWSINIGRAVIYLLDTNVIANHPEDRRITETLYGGDHETRMKQEIVLGIGGVQALSLLGIKATVFHMNEGHSAFLALERIRCLMSEQNLTFEEAREATRVGNVFTTHTPVPAGIDRFNTELMTTVFQDYWPTLGLDKESFLRIGGADPSNPESTFNMAVLATKFSAFTNGVSKLHGEVSRQMWQYLWPEVPIDDVLIKSITNGIHAKSWISAEIMHLFDRYIGPDWQENPQNRELWGKVHSITDEELWRARERCRERLISFARKRMRKQLENRGASKVAIERAGEVLDMETLTIGFARRFATYKRASLLLQDVDRLTRILTNPEMPVQVLFAGKAHPMDEPGKKMIREIIHLAKENGIRNKLVFLENYDINVARHMVQGCDVWLNNPLRLMEASGTSGMKAAVNGVLHCSTLDGWWDEAYNPEVGWAIGRGETYDDPNHQAQVESNALYDLLEKEIVPLFYRRDRAKVPREWTKMVKQMLEQICPEFMSTRMVSEYTQDAYMPCHRISTRLGENGYQRAKALTKWQERIKDSWSKVNVLEVHERDGKTDLHVGDSIEVVVTVQLGPLSPEDVRVELLLGKLRGDRELSGGRSVPLHFKEKDDKENLIYEGGIRCEESGFHGFTIKVTPDHADLNNPLDLGLIAWE